MYLHVFFFLINYPVYSPKKKSSVYLKTEVNITHLSPTSKPLSVLPPYLATVAVVRVVLVKYKDSAVFL